MLESGLAVQVSVTPLLLTCAARLDIVTNPQANKIEAVRINTEVLLIETTIGPNLFFR